MSSQNPSSSTDGSTAASTDQASAVSWQENVAGSARAGRVQNVSWGAIFAGVVTFLAIVLLFSLLTAAFGLDASGTGAAVTGIIGLLLAFFGAGAVAGAMAVRGGLVHGFLTWATSLLAVVLLLVVLAASAASAAAGVLGSLAGALGGAAAPALSQVNPSDVPSPSPEQSQQAQQQAQETAQGAAQATQAGATRGFFGLLLGAGLATLGGLLGSRSVANKNSTEINRSTGRER